jgi:hypothetical protein
METVFDEDIGLDTILIRISFLISKAEHTKDCLCCFSSMTEIIHEIFEKSNKNRHIPCLKKFTIEQKVDDNYIFWCEMEIVAFKDNDNTLEELKKWISERYDIQRCNVVPEQVRYEVPEQVRYEVPEQVRYEVPEQVRYEVPEQVRYEVPEQVRHEVPEQV